MDRLPPNIDDLYVILRGWAVAKKYGTYLSLSKEYEARTHEWFEPHGSWDAPLGNLNLHLHEHGAPALSALVVVGEKGEPGGGFWGSAPSVPSRPKKDLDRVAAWSEIVKKVHAYPWPPSLP